MQKIHCPECLKTFVWTDHMPMKGKCPTSDCDWRYDIHEELRKSVSKRMPQAQRVILCPSCQSPIASTWGLCESCGEVVLGSKHFKKRYLFFVVALLLIIMSLIYNYGL
jgi:hypothetical protein